MDEKRKVIYSGAVRAEKVDGKQRCWWDVFSNADVNYRDSEIGHFLDHQFFGWVFVSRHNFLLHDEIAALAEIVIEIKKEKA